MIRVIKRYGGGSRKLYDTEESRYVSMEEISAWIRGGQELQVVDSATGDDVTAQTLTQTLFEDHKRGLSLLPAQFLHELIRKGQQTFTESVEQVQARMDRMVQAGMDKLSDTLSMEEEMGQLRLRMAELEASLVELEHLQPPAKSGGRSAKGSRRPTRR